MKTAYWFVLPWEIEYAGGVNQVVMNLNNHLSQRGLNSSIFVQCWHDINFRKINKDGISLRYGRLRAPLSGTIKANLMYWLTLPATLLRLTKTLREENVVCINPHYPTSSVLTFVFLRKLGVFRGRLLLSFHGSEFTKIESEAGFNLLLWHFILRNADTLVACSKSLAARITAKFPNLAAQVKTIHNGFDPEVFENERDKNACLPAELIGSDFILTVGTYERKKGHDVLLQAFKRISDSFPCLKLVFIGRTGPTLDELLQMVIQFGLEDRIMLIKDLPHASLGPFLENAKIFILPSRIEPFGIVVLEAGSLGLPVIASRVGGLPEILTSPEMGILVEADDSWGLSSAIAKVLNEPAWAKLLGENLRHHVQSNFSWRRAADNYLALLNSKSFTEFGA